MKGVQLMKRILALLCCLATLTLVGCTENGDDERKPGKGNAGQIQLDDSFVAVSEIDSKYIQKNGGDIYIDATAPYFTVGGIEHPDDNEGEWYRLDAGNKKKYSKNVAELANNTAGVTLRFRTNADYFYLNVTMLQDYTGLEYDHFANRGVFGLDVYTGTGTNRVYCGGLMQMMVNKKALKEQILLPGGEQEVMIHFPLYAGVESVKIGLPEDAMIAPATERSYTAPICFYGSSITQGSAVSRPGNAYSNIVCRMLNADNMNLGFSGSAFGESAVAQYIASREIAALVMDYDHNAASPEALRDTHYAFYKLVRREHPDIPIVMVTRPIYTKDCTADDLARQQVIQESYNKAVASGDQNVYFVNGNEFFDKTMPDLYTVDLVHPNDLGHYFMAQSIYAVLSEALDK